MHLIHHSSQVFPSILSICQCVGTALGLPTLRVRKVGAGFLREYLGSAVNNTLNKMNRHESENRKSQT